MNVEQVEKGVRYTCPNCALPPLVFEFEQRGLMHTCNGKLVKWKNESFDVAAFNERMLALKPKPAEPAERPPRERPKLQACIHLGTKLEKTFPPKDGAGDIVKGVLKKMGITEKKWNKLKAAMVLQTTEEEDCSGCEWRRKALNWLGRKLGVGVKSEHIAQMLSLESGKRLPLYECAMFGECCPTIKQPIKIDGAPQTCGKHCPHQKFLAQN